VGKARKIFPTVKLVAPADGFVTMRNVYTEQHFDKGVELYRIVDLSHVWIMADLFEDQMAGAQPAAGTSVSIRLPGGEEIPARLSNALPQFDPSTRVTKIRVEAENPHSALKPDMFVDLRFATRGKPGLSVPRDSVIDSGLSKTVFIAKGNGYFEPRAVQTGWRSGGRVQIVSGLKPGEQIVISGNFLLDSESRLKSGTENADDQPHH
jgi:membrane fusion protein, copper/silver efflux system